jgi:hypothetical protein
MAPLLPLLHILWFTVCFAGAAHIAHVVASDEYLPCEAAVHSWAIKETEIVDREVQLKSADGLQLRDLLFFLHIPRTGGRTYHQCFLKQLFLSEERCRISYDKLRFDPRLVCAVLCLSPLVSRLLIDDKSHPIFEISVVYQM